MEEKKMNTLDFTDIEKLSGSKDTIENVKRQPIKWGKTCLMRDSYLGSIKNSTRELKDKRPDGSPATRLNRHFITEDTRMREKPL